MLTLHQTDYVSFIQRTNMERKKDKLTFEGAWDDQLKQENDDKKTSETKPVKKFEEPKFRGQRDIEEKRTEFIVSKKATKNSKPQKTVEIVKELSSKEGDDFDVQW